MGKQVANDRLDFWLGWLGWWGLIVQLFRVFGNEIAWGQFCVGILVGLGVGIVISIVGYIALFIQPVAGLVVFIGGALAMTVLVLWQIWQNAKEHGAWLAMRKEDAN